MQNALTTVIFPQSVKLSGLPVFKMFIGRQVVVGKSDVITQQHHREHARLQTLLRFLLTKNA
jgi:hypothetical protein